jgi:hypothetical protein
MSLGMRARAPGAHICLSGQAGFRDVAESEAMFLRLLDEFRARKVIP